MKMIENAKCDNNVKKQFIYTLLIGMQISIGALKNDLSGSAKVNLCMLYESTIPLSSIEPTEMHTHVHRKTQIRLLISALSVVAPTSKNLNAYQ